MVSGAGCADAGSPHGRIATRSRLRLISPSICLPTENRMNGARAPALITAKLQIETLAWNHANMQVLVVEDERRMAELLRQGLEEEGHSVFLAGDGKEGLAIAESHSFDAIVL